MLVNVYNNIIRIMYEKYCHLPMLWRHLQILVNCYDDIDGGDFMRQCADFVGV